MAIIALSALGTARGDDTPKGQGGRQSAATKKYFYPKIALTDIRMAFCNKGRLTIQLKDTYATLALSLLESGALGSTETGSLPEEVSLAAQEKAFVRIPEQKGDRYTLFFPNSLTSRTFGLTGLTFLWEGGGLGGFLGVLGEEGACPTCTTSPVRAYAVAIKGTPRIRANSMPERPLLESDRQTIASLAIKSAGLVNACLDEARTIYCRYPDVPGAIALVHNCDTGDQYMTVLIERNDAWEIFPIETTSGHVFPDQPDSGWASKGNCIVYLNRAPTNCGYFMQNSEFFVLPDIDGNAASEVLLVSDIISILFSVERSADGQYVLKEVQSARFDL